MQIKLFTVSIGDEGNQQDRLIRKIPYVKTMPVAHVVERYVFLPQTDKELPGNTIH